MRRGRASPPTHSHAVAQQRADCGPTPDRGGYYSLFRSRLPERYLLKAHREGMDLASLPWLSPRSRPTSTGAQLGAGVLEGPFRIDSASTQQFRGGR